MLDSDSIQEINEDLDGLVKQKNQLAVELGLKETKNRELK